MAAPSATDPGSALHALPIPALLVDPEGRVVSTNRPFDDLAGRTDPPGFRTWWEFMSACGIDPLAARSALLTRRTPIELRLAINDRALPCEVLTAPCDDERRLVLFWHTGERPQRDARYRESIRMEAMQSVALHISNIFNNVLAAIAGHIESAQAREADPAVELREAMTAVNRAARTVRGLQRMVRPVPAHRRPLDPADVVTAAISAVQAAFPADVTLHTELGHGNWMVLGDEEQLVDVLVNILHNARDAVGTSGTVSVRTRQHTSASGGDRGPAELHTTPFVGIDIADSGPGIDPEILPRIFEPYYSTKGQAGLGLAGVYQVLKQHAGGVHVDSRPHDGTTFRLYLPQAVGATEPDTDRRRPGETADGGTVLIVDDDPAIRRVLTKTLERVGYAVLEATGGTEGLDLLERHADRIDLVVLDVIMPDLSGWSVLTAIREHPTPPPVIIQSGFMTEVDSDAAAQAEAFLRKPYELDEFLNTVRQVLGPAAGPVTDEEAG